jgi:hypothetical protein
LPEEENKIKENEQESKKKVTYNQPSRYNNNSSTNAFQDIATDAPSYGSNLFRVNFNTTHEA